MPIANLSPAATPAPDGQSLYGNPILWIILVVIAVAGIGAVVYFFILRK